MPDLVRRRFLVTGSSGFIGAHLVGRLAELGADVYAPYRGSRAPVRLRHTAGIHLLSNVDVTDAGAVRSSFREAQPEIVLHLATRGVQVAQELGRAVERVNIEGTANVIRAALDTQVRRFVLVGTGFEYASVERPADEATSLRPDTLYGATKAAAWMLADFYHRVHGLPLVTVRPFSVFGPGENVSRFVPYVITAALRQEPVRMTSGDQKRDYLFVSDVVDALLRAATISGGEGAVYNVGSGEVRSVADVAEMILTLMGNPITLERGAVGRKRLDSNVFVADTRRAQDELGWSPSIGLKEGLQRTIDWYQKNEDLWGALT